MECPKVFCVQNCIVTKTILSILQSLSGRKINMCRTIYLQQYFTLCGLNDQLGPAWVWATNLVLRIGTHNIVLDSFGKQSLLNFFCHRPNIFFLFYYVTPQVVLSTSPTTLHFIVHKQPCPLVTIALLLLFDPKWQNKRPKLWCHLFFFLLV